MNRFDERFAAVGVDSLLDHFGERDDDDAFVAVSILAAPAETPFDWPRVIVGKLTERYAENDRGELEARETVTLSGSTAQLETGSTPLTDAAEIIVTKYGETPFHVVPEECEYGGVMTKITLARAPVRQLSNFHQTRAG
jgi:hypothetical protein